MSTEEQKTEQKSTYVLVPATIVEEENGKTHGKRGKGRQHYLPYGAKVVEGGYIYNGTFYTDFSSELGKRMIKTSLIPKLEFVFSEKYLSVDKFLRPYIDVEGYFPISLLLFIPAIQSFGVDALFLMDTLEECPFAEVDKTRFTVRPKQNWEK